LQITGTFAIQQEKLALNAKTVSEAIIALPQGLSKAEASPKTSG
jgi:hypothetical protein